MLEKGLPYLSIADRRCQVRTQLDFWLVVDNDIKQFRPIEPLIGRQFENNKQDCRNIILDCYMLAGIELPEQSTYEFEWFKHSWHRYLSRSSTIALSFRHCEP